MEVALCYVSSRLSNTCWCNAHQVTSQIDLQLKRLVVPPPFPFLVIIYGGAGVLLNAHSTTVNVNWCCIIGVKAIVFVFFSVRS